MAKATSAPMDTHLTGEVTSLAMATVITRTDGQKFHLTTSSEDIRIDIGDGDGEQVYLASEGVGRTNIESDAELNVDNLDIVGIFDNDVLKENELRSGLFDFADFKIFVFNHQNTSDGIIKIFRGELGEVVTVPRGFFTVTVRSLVQVYSKETGEHYTKDCRADLGDIRCTVPIFPDEAAPFDRSFPVAYLQSNTSYFLGDFIVIPAAIDPSDCSQVVINAEGTDGSTSIVNSGTHGNPTQVVGNAQIDTAQAPAGGDSTSSLLLDGTGDYLRWTDNAAFVMGANPVTIQTHFRLNALGSNQVIASQYSNAGNQRSWFLRVGSSNVLNFTVFADGITTDVSLTGTTVLTTGVNYHAAIVRKTNGDWVLFLDGNIEAGPTTPTGNPFTSTTDFRIGALDSSGIVQFFNGWIDSFELLIGFPRWETTFTPPTGSLNVSTVPINERPWEDFADRLYEVTTAGTSAVCPQTPDTTLNNTHNQGTAVLTTRNSWMRFAEVVAVGVNPRKEFTVTELTPNSGQAVNSVRTPSSLGFPNDWFNGGAVYFDTGSNAGVAKEVRDFVADDGITIEQDIIMFDTFPFEVQIGDKLRIFPGCDKLNSTCIAKFNNVINFVGEPYVPGEDVLATYPDAR